MEEEGFQWIATGLADLDEICDGGLIAGRAYQVRVAKLRGSDVASGRHAVRLTWRGREVFPRMIPKVDGREWVAETTACGHPHRLCREATPLGARMPNVVDVYDARHTVAVFDLCDNADRRGRGWDVEAFATRQKEAWHVDEKAAREVF